MLTEGLKNPLLERVLVIQIIFERLIFHPHKGQHARMFARAVMPVWRGFFPVEQ